MLHGRDVFSRGRGMGWLGSRGGSDREPGGFRCSGCDEWHPTVPLAFHAPSPAYWSADLEHADDCALGSDQCIIRSEHFFIRGLVEVPIIDRAESFEWGVWVSLSEDNFARTSQLWEVTGRETEAPMFGWLSTELPIFPDSTLGLKTMVHTREVGLRPLVILEPTQHPLAIEQREGITWAAVTQRAERLLHPA